MYWVEDEEDKKKLIAEYRERNKKIQCKYVKGSDISGCPFGNKCFFKHELPDGTVAEVQSPHMLRRCVVNNFVLLSTTALHFILLG